MMIMRKYYFWEQRVTPSERVQLVSIRRRFAASLTDEDKRELERIVCDG